MELKIGKAQMMLDVANSQHSSSMMRGGGQLPPAPGA